MAQEKVTPVTSEAKDDLGIVSVNSRSGASHNAVAKIVFVVVVGSVLVISALMGFNKWKAHGKAEAAKEEQAAKVENKPAQVGHKRVFDTDPPASRTAIAGGKAGDMDRRVVVPGVELGADETGRPIPLSGGRGSGGATRSQTTTPVSRFGGEAISASSGAATAPRTQHAAESGPEASIALVRDLLGADRRGDPMETAGMLSSSSQPLVPNGNPPASEATPAPPPPSSTSAGTGELGVAAPMVTYPGIGMPLPPRPAASGAGPIGGLLTPSTTPKIEAGMLGDRNMILPKGKSMDCALTVRVVNEVAGMATCVLNSDVYSDNGRVVLLDRGSEAVGEYTATMAQGQRRLFLLWTRVKTPSGVVINLNSPGADELGTSGLPGYVDNHWWDRLGAAFLLSLVQDAIGLVTAQSAGGTGQGQLGIYQNSATTGNRMAKLVLQSTINIKPTLYKNQGDRATIFVARDLDFGSVYGLRAN